MRTLKLTFAVVSTAAALAVGVAVGAAAVDPEVETVVETVTETVETTPDACQDTVAAGDDLLDLFIEYTEISADGWGAAADFDWVGVEDATRRVEDLTTRVTDVIEAYGDASTGCVGDGGDVA